MNADEFLKLFWKHYQLIEEDLLDSDKYVSIDRDNSAVFSYHYLKSLITICCEIDSIAEVICNCNGKKADFGIINKLRVLADCIPNFHNLRVITRKQYDSMNVVPFVKFIDNNTPEWWRAYNSVKHDRANKKGERLNLSLANQKNVLYALAALYLLEKQLYLCVKDKESIEEEIIESKLFKAEN